MLLLSSSACVAQNVKYNGKAEIDAAGNIFVSSDAGKLIWMGNTERCAEATVAPDGQTVMCVVMQNPAVGNALPPLTVEIYQRGGKKKVIEPGGAIRGWHFWQSGQQVAVYFGEPNTQGTHALYDLGEMKVIEKVSDPEDERQLPQWAKNSTQIQDESVPESSALSDERTQWISKVLRQINKIQPGMTRKDLFNVFRAEGGFSNRLHRTYVYAQCPYIKVDVNFRAANDEGDVTKNDPQDVIVSVSLPYLGWSVTD